MIKMMLVALMICAGIMSSVMANETVQSRFKVEESLDISEVPSGCPVGFCLLTSGDMQFVGYYDKERRMTIASRSLDSNQWTYQTLPSEVGWDSHNYITMAVDEDGQLHVSGNMHVDPLVYFRTEKPGDITTLKKLPMTGQNEDRCTYPKFMRDAENRLIFHYRDGGSGRGNEIYNVYDLDHKRWRRLLDVPLTDGRGRMNAYIAGPTRGPDGWFNIHWVWRDTPDCATNHHLSFARSRDMLHWESVFGDEVELPITIDEESLWVDPIPSGGGIINGAHRLFFDENNLPIITYHKSDDEGNMQVYAARPEDGRWKLHQLTDWQEPVEFSGRGSMGFIGISISGLTRVEPGLLTMTYRHRDYGSGRLVISEQTLQPIDKEVEFVQEYPEELNRVQSDFEGMGIRRARDIGKSEDESVRYILQWETLGNNNDRPRKPPLPQPSMLRLYKLSTTEETGAEDQ